MNLALKVIPPVQVLLASGLMYSITILFPQFNFELQQSLVIAAFLFITAGVIGSLALYDFHRHQTTFHPHTPEKTRTVVDSGIFSFSRNPMYIALAIILCAIAIILKNYCSFVILPLFIWYITQFQIIPEENVLNKLFPDDYQAYCQKVRRWL